MLGIPPLQKNAGVNRRTLANTRHTVATWAAIRFRLAGLERRTSACAAAQRLATRSSFVLNGGIGTLVPKRRAGPPSRAEPRTVSTTTR